MTERKFQKTRMTQIVEKALLSAIVTHTDRYEKQGDPEDRRAAIEFEAVYNQMQNFQADVRLAPRDGI